MSQRSSLFFCNRQFTPPPRLITNNSSRSRVGNENLMQSSVTHVPWISHSGLINSAQNDCAVMSSVCWGLLVQGLQCVKDSCRATTAFTVVKAN